MAAKVRLSTLSKVGCVWTVTRLAYGFLALTTITQGWLEDAQQSELLYSVTLICIFVGAEVLPIIFALQPSVLQSLSAVVTTTTTTNNTVDRGYLSQSTVGKEGSLVVNLLHQQQQQQPASYNYSVNAAQQRLSSRSGEGVGNNSITNITSLMFGQEGVGASGGNSTTRDKEWTIRESSRDSDNDEYSSSTGGHSVANSLNSIESEDAYGYGKGFAQKKSSTWGKWMGF